MFQDQTGTKIMEQNGIRTGELHPDPTQYTFGQRAVGITFNPSGLDEVGKCKQIFADAIDQLNDFRNNPKTSQGAKRHASTAITQIEDAQMRAVKALTWKE